jgi:hypothetical protein
MKIKIFLLIIFVFMVGYKVFSNINNENFNPKNDTALFWTESALQYRTAKIIAKDGAISALDKKLQFPEGLDMKNRLTIFMEVITGYTYRLLVPKSIPFHVFLLIFIGLFSSLSIFPLYGSIYLITTKKLAGLFGAALYASTPAIYTTITAPGYEYQDFALPLIFFHLYLFVYAMKLKGAGSYAYAFMSASFLFAAFAAWHLTQFYYVLFVFFIILSFLFIKDFNLKPFYVIAGISILAGLIIPSQKSAAFLLSLSMLLSYAIIISSMVPKRLTRHRRLIAIVLFLIVAVVTLYIAFVSVAEYRFVYGLMWDKIKHLGMRPSDPTILPWETLVMWVSPFIGPSFNTIMRAMGPIFVLGITGVIISLFVGFRKKLTVHNSTLLFFSIIFFPLYLLLIRMDAFLVWFLSFQAGRLLIIKKRAMWFVFIVCFLINGFLLIIGMRRFVGPDQNYLLGMIKYIRYNVPKNSPVLTSFAYGPSIVTYTERPILLHPKFEAEHITCKIKKFEHRLFKNEETFYSFCKSYGAEYFVYQTDMLLAQGTESIRYRTYNLLVSKNCAAYKFHFCPENLKFFELLYSNPHYRIYRVLKKGETVRHRAIEYLRVYDENLFDLRNFGIE